MMRRRYEIRYRMPPHGTGSELRSFEDEFDAEMYAEEKYGDALMHVKPCARNASETVSQSQDWNVRNVPDRTTT